MSPPRKELKVSHFRSVEQDNRVMARVTHTRRGYEHWKQGPAWATAGWKGGKRAGSSWPRSTARETASLPSQPLEIRVTEIVRPWWDKLGPWGLGPSTN